jgi:hypothetical protein
MAYNRSWEANTVNPLYTAKDGSAICGVISTVPVNKKFRIF